MEISNITWLKETTFYMVLFFTLFLIAKQLLKFKNRKIDFDKELTEKDNVAFSIVTTGYFISILTIFIGTIQGTSKGLLIDFIEIMLYGVAGIVLLFISSALNQKIIFSKKFSLYKEIIKDENNGTGYIEAANYFGSGLIIFGAISGETVNFLPNISLYGALASNMISLLILWFLGQCILLLFLSLYSKFSPYNILNEIEKDNQAAGIVYASLFLSISYLYSQAIKGNLDSWFSTFENIGFYMMFGMILLPLSRLIVDKLILPKRSLTDEIIHQEIPNIGAALIEAFAYIGSAVLISYCI